ncbi:MAG: hypothetical protein R2939_18040 [Kofleriaceae bacterium]
MNHVVTRVRPGFALLAALVTTILGCGPSSAPMPVAPTPPGGSPAPEDTRPNFAGEWFDQSGSAFVIEGSGDATRVVRVYDADGEDMTNLQSGWDDQGRFWWSYHVDSTGYDVKIVVTTIDGDDASFEWSNAYDSGTESMRRGGSPDDSFFGGGDFGDYGGFGYGGLTYGAGDEDEDW